MTCFRTRTYAYLSSLLFTLIFSASPTMRSKDMRLVVFNFTWTHFFIRVSFPALSFLLFSFSLLFPCWRLRAFPRYLSLLCSFHSRRVSLNFPASVPRFSFFPRHLLARSLSPFHFSIVEGKIIYLSAAFRLPSPLGCSYVPVLHCPETGDEDLLAAFHSFHERDSSRIVDRARESCDYRVFTHACNACKQQEEA